MNAKTIVLPILLKFIRQALMIAGAWFVRQGWVSAEDGNSLLAYIMDSIPGLLLLVPGIVWDLWTWLNKFQFIVKLETNLHLPVTGQPSVEALVETSGKSKSPTNPPAP